MGITQTWRFHQRNDVHKKSHQNRSVTVTNIDTCFELVDVQMDRNTKLP